MIRDKREAQEKLVQEERDTQARLEREKLERRRLEREVRTTKVGKRVTDREAETGDGLESRNQTVHWYYARCCHRHAHHVTTNL